MIEIAKADIKTMFGTFEEIMFSDGNRTVYALAKGNIKNKERVLCRIHSQCISAHYFYSVGCDCSKQMIFSQKIIEKEGEGIIIWLEQEGRGNGHYAKLTSEQYKSKGLNQSDAYIEAGYPGDNRNYNEAKKVLDFLNIKSIVLISSNTSKKLKLKDLGINVISTIDLGKCIIDNNYSI